MHVKNYYFNNYLFCIKRFLIPYVHFSEIGHVFEAVIDGEFFMYSAILLILFKIRLILLNHDKWVSIKPFSKSQTRHR